MVVSVMARQGAPTDTSYCTSGGDPKSTSQLQPLADPIFHDFLGVNNEDASIHSALKTPDVSLSEPSSSAFSTSTGARRPFSATSDLTSSLLFNRARDHLQGIPFYSTRNEISTGPENGNRVAGIKRSNPDSAFMGPDGNQNPNVAGGDPTRYNDNEVAYTMQPPRIDSSTDEESRTGKQICRRFSSINAGHDDGRHSTQMLPSCEGQTSRTEVLEQKSSNPPSPQGLDANNGQMIIFYGGLGFVFNNVHRNKADIIMTLAGSNGGSWSATLAPKSHVIVHEAFQRKSPENLRNAEGLKDSCPRSVSAKETREPVYTAEPNAEGLKHS